MAMATMPRRRLRRRASATATAATLLCLLLAASMTAPRSICAFVAPPGVGTAAVGRRARRAATITVATEMANRAAPPEQKKQASKKREKTKKQELPESQLVDRRKSPALWRYDLTPEDDDLDLGDVAAGADSVDHDAADSTKKAEAAVKFFPSRPPEIMAPAGGFPQLHAAIANGADAVYLGLSSYSARARASNFDLEELEQAVRYAHRYGVKVYVALNTLVFDGELDEVAGILREVQKRGVDAIIVQDLGITKIAAQVAPGLEVHASTQQTVTDYDGVAFAAEQSKATRVVLGRELSVEELGSVTHQAAARGEGVEIEAFVHGALCVSYSGQCFSSEAWGGRSANRGQCAQACRLPYGLIDNGELKHLGDVSYLLSPQDLCGLEHVPALVKSGVACLKIEGRLKDEFYVAATTRAYREAVDVAWNDLQRERGLLSAEENSDDYSWKALDLPTEHVSRSDLLQLFSRGQDASHSGLTPGFFDGPHHQSLVRGNSPRHRGVHLGTVSSFTNPGKGMLVIECDDEGLEMLTSLKKGDGLVIDRGLAQEEELGGPVFETSSVKHHSDGLHSVAVRFGREVTGRWRDHDLDLGGWDGDSNRGGRGGQKGGGNRRGGSNQGDTTRPLVPPGAHVWRTSDASVASRMRKLAGAEPPRTYVTASISGSVGSPLRVTLTSIDGTPAVGESAGVLEQAKEGGAGLSPAKVRKAVGLLGGTRFAVKGGTEGIDVSALEEGTWCPVSFVKEARRKAVEELLVGATGDDLDLADDEQDEDNVGVSSPSYSADSAAKAVEGMLDDLRADPKLTGEDEEEEAAQKTKTRTGVSVLCRTYDQVDAICRLAEERLESSSSDDDKSSSSEHRVDEIIIDFLEVSGMQEAVSRIRSSPASADLSVVAASPRILKPGEGGIWRTLLRLEPDGLLVRSAGLLHRMVELGGEGSDVDVGWGADLDASDDDDDDEDHTQRKQQQQQQEGPNIVRIPRLLGDFSLNAANALSALEYLSSGLSRIAASYDLSASAVTELALSMGGPHSPGAAQLEAVVHAHLPIFHTEHCVFARFLTKGDSYLDCGHACTRHNIHLRDETGKDNLVLADMGCRNTVFAAAAQSGVHSLKEWTGCGSKAGGAGVGTVRIELVDEGPDDAARIAGGYLDVLDGTRSAGEVWEMLGTEVTDSNGRVGGVGHGSLRNGMERRAGEIA